MKLYFSPGACSMSPHIVLAEAGLAYATERVDLRQKRTAGGADFSAINPRGYVPALETADGTVLTEGPAIVQYIADMVPEKKLVPPFGTFERYQMMELLNFISSELHQNFGPLFNPQAGAEASAGARAQLARRLDAAAATLGGHDYLTGARFSVADAYLFTVLNWAAVVQLDLSPWPALQAFHARVADRPAVRRAMREEGLSG